MAGQSFLFSLSLSCHPLLAALNCRWLRTQSHSIDTPKSPPTQPQLRGFDA